MKSRILSLLAVGLLAGPMLADAAQIAYGSFSGTVIDFDGLAGSAILGSGESLSNQYVGSGVTFDVPSFGAFASTSIAGLATLNSDPNVIWVNQGGGTASSVGMNINFATPQGQVGLWMGGSLGSTFSLAVFNGATLLEQLTLSLPFTGELLEGFLALSGSNITRAVVYSTNGSGQNWNFSVDDLKFNSASGPVPEPGTLALLGLGLAGLGLSRRRRA